MVDLDNISNNEDQDKSKAPVRNINETSVNRLKISCEHFRYKRCIWILVGIISISIIITLPTVLVLKRKIKINTTETITTTTMTIITTTTTKIITTMITTTEGRLNSIINETTKWKENGITVFHQLVLDEFYFDDTSIYIDDDENIYIPETKKHRVIKLNLNTRNFSIVAGGNGDGDGINQLSSPNDVIVDKKTDSIIICDTNNYRVVRWFRQNTINGEIIFQNIQCHGLAMDDKGYLYVSNWFKHEVRRWEIGVNTEGIIVAGGNSDGNEFRQLCSPRFIFVDKDYSVYVADLMNNRVMKWMRNATIGIVVAGGNNDGAYLTQLFRPYGVIVDHSGNVYVADTNNHRVMRWLNGATQGTIVVGGNGEGNETNQLHTPTDLLFDKRGNLYVFDALNYRLQRFDIESN